MKIILVVAMSENRVIGKDGALPWHISADLKHFKALTLGHPVVMGRRTWDSIGRPLPDRHNIVVTRNPEWEADGVDIVRTLDGALDLCRDLDAEKAMIIGGGQIYADILRDADVIEMTEVHETVDGDTFFPEIDPAMWEEVARERHPPEKAGGPAYSFVRFERR